MKKVILAIIIITLQSCIEKEGYYNDGQNKIISLICDTIWCRDKINNENGTTYQDAYNFNEDGTYEHIIITTDSEGTEHINKPLDNGHSMTLHLIPFILVTNTTGI